MFHSSCVMKSDMSLLQQHSSYGSQLQHDATHQPPQPMLLPAAPAQATAGPRTAGIRLSRPGEPRARKPPLLLPHSGQLVRCCSQPQLGLDLRLAACAARTPVSLSAAAHRCRRNRRLLAQRRTRLASCPPARPPAAWRSPRR
jgi:hypothetical protein